MRNALELKNVSRSFTGFEMKDMTFSLPEVYSWAGRKEWGREKYDHSSDHGYDS